MNGNEQAGRIPTLCLTRCVLRAACWHIHDCPLDKTQPVQRRHRARSDLRSGRKAGRARLVALQARAATAHRAALPRRNPRARALITSTSRAHQAGWASHRIRPSALIMMGDAFITSSSKRDWRLIGFGHQHSSRWGTRSPRAHQSGMGVLYIYGPAISTHHDGESAG